MAKNYFNKKSLNAGPLLVLAAVVLIVTLATFSEVLKADFVMWDDDLDILGNKKLTESSLWWMFTDVDSMQRYNPLTFLAWSVTYHLTGFDPYWFAIALNRCENFPDEIERWPVKMLQSLDPRVLKRTFLDLAVKLLDKTTRK